MKCNKYYTQYYDTLLCTRVLYCTFVLYIHTLCIVTYKTQRTQTAAGGGRGGFCKLGAMIYLNYIYTR